MAVRTILGLLESPISPGFLIIVTAWYKREEQLPRSMAFLSVVKRGGASTASLTCTRAMNSFFSLFILMINYAVGKAAIGSSIPSWRAINRTFAVGPMKTAIDACLSVAWSCVFCLGLHSLVETLSSRLRLLAQPRGQLATWTSALTRLLTYSKEKVLAKARLIQNQGGQMQAGVKLKWYQVRECFRDPQILFLMAITLLNSMASGGW